MNRTSRIKHLMSTGRVPYLSRVGELLSGGERIGDRFAGTAIVRR